MKKYNIVLLTLFLSQHAFAQPAVKDEPRHHLVFENEYLRILDVHLAPNDTTQYHVHQTPSVFIALSKTITTNQSLGQPVNPVRYDEIKAWYDPIPSPRIHRVWNSDSSWLHIMDVELTAGRQKSNPPIIQSPFLQLLFNELQVTGYRLELPADNSIALPISDTGYLLVSLANSVIRFDMHGGSQKRMMKAGHYIWIPAGGASTLTNLDQSKAELVLLHLK